MKVVPSTDPSVPDGGGEPFGKYVLLERIGAGGMAEVFHAVSRGPEGFQRSLVIKRILPHLSLDRTFVRMFIDEAKVCGLLSHPNLVQVYEFGKIGDTFFIAMEHIHGRTLNAVKAGLAKRGRPAPLAAVTEIGRQICVGLHHAHSLRSANGQPLGIVHRDISPSNVMLAFHGGVTILDFGIARMADELRHTHTQVGGVKGKASYMSPEQIQNADVDRRSDIFSVGVVLHELLSGRRLFAGGRGVVDGKPVELSIPPPSERNAAVPPALDRIVMRALAFERDARYATAGEMATDLEEVMREERMSPREHVKLLDELFPEEASASDLRVVLPASPSGPVEAPIDLADGMEPGPSGEPAMGGGDSAGRERQKTGRRIRVGAAGLSLLALVTVPVVLQATRRPGPHLAPAPALAPPSAVDLPRHPAATPAPAPAATNAHCFLDSRPPGATVTRVDNGRVVGRTPLIFVVPRSKSPVSLRFERPGTKPVVQEIVPDDDKLIRVELGVETSEPATRRKRRPAAARDFRDATLVNPFTM